MTQEQRDSRATIRLGFIGTLRVLWPYFRTKLLEQVKGIWFIVAYLFLFQAFILGLPIVYSTMISAGVAIVVLGLMFFLEGLRLGLMPFGETIGAILPRNCRMSVILSFAFLLGIGATFAEPAIAVLKAAGAGVSPSQAPLLYSLLNDFATQLVLVVGIGVGIAVALGVLRFFYGWSLKVFIIPCVLILTAMTLFAQSNEVLAQIIALAWDCGAVTTGPVTVPLVLSLGVGIASAAGKGNSSLSGFGIVTLASIFPITMVLGLAVYLSMTVSPESIIATSQAVVAQASSSLLQETPYMEIISGVRSIVPLVLFLFLVLKLLLREKILEPGILTYGLFLSVIGMIIFNIGLTYGLAKLGSQSGGFVPAAFIPLESVDGSPLYTYSLGVSIALLFAWILGFGATLAEPALNALGETVENLTNGAFRKNMLMMAVSIGVGFGISLGVLKIIFEIPISYLLLPGYALGILLTTFSSEEFVNVAWDSAGVTTGPITVPLVLAMGLGFGDAVQAVEGFGILSMASICPILSVLIMGLWIQFKTRRANLQRINLLKIQEAVA